jgi:hypothetical protein
MFAICSVMSSAPPAPDASAQPAPAPQPAGHAGLPWWLKQLAVIAATLARRMGGLDAHHEANPTVPAIIDLDLACHLVGRAMRWMTALVARIVAERKAASAAAVQADRLTGRDASGKPACPSAREAAPGARAERERGISGKPAAEVIGQICADLTAAATLLQSPALVRQIAEIAAAARALLDGPRAAWRPLPMIRRGRHAASDAAAAAAAAMIAAVMPVPAPDTG